MNEWEVVSEQPIESQGNEWEVVDEKPVDQGFFSRVGEDISKRWQNIKDIDAPTYGQASLRGAGQIAALGSDIIGQGLKSAYRTITPQATQDMFAEGAKNVGEYYAKPISAVAEGYSSFAKENPNLSKDIEAVGNIAQFVPMGKGAQVVGKEAVNIAQDAAMLAGKTAEQQIDNAIQHGIQKAIRPTVVGKHTDTQIKQYYENATNAVKNIVGNRENLVLTSADGSMVKGELPKSLNQFSEAIDQTKRSIFKQYDDMAKQSGQQGVAIDLKGIEGDLVKIAGDKVTRTVSPEVAKHAMQWSEQLKNVGSFTAEETQNAISQLNKGLEAFYKNPTYEGATKAGIDAIVVGKLRANLDNAITNTIGEGYQGLKQSYGSLKAIEKEVAHRSVVDSRKNMKGLIDFADVFTYGDFIAGLGTMNPGLIMKAVTQKGVQSYIKHANNPNNIVKGMFGDVDNIIKREAQGYKSKTGKLISDTMPENPLSAGNIPTVPNVPYYSKQTSVPSVDVKSGVTKGEPYGMEQARLNRQKGLPSGQGFSLSGEPYTPDVIDAMFTSSSRPIRALDMPKRDAVLQLPAGQGFTKYGENVTLKGLRDYQKALKKKID
jgi:hypothetical protein